MANTTQARGSSTMDRNGREGETTGDGEGQNVEANERGTEQDEREGRVRGRVISFLCLLLIYSDAPRLSASGANKFLEPPWQLDTLPSPRTFSPGLPSPPWSSLRGTFSPRDPPQRRDIPAASNSPVRRRRAARCNSS